MFSARETAKGNHHAQHVHADGEAGPVDGYDRDPHARSQPNAGDFRDEDSDVSSVVKQEGVARMEAISSVWTNTSLFVAYGFFFLLAITLSLDNSTIFTYQPVATSEFGEHSLLATIGIIQNLLFAVVKPPLAKCSDVFGRTESFAFAILVLTVGFIMLAASPNFQTFAGAQIFYTAGQVGVQFMQQIFVADTTDLMWRSLFIILPQTPFLFTTWCAAPITTRILANSTFRWGYGMYAIIVPATGIPFLLCLMWNQRKASKYGKAPVPAWKTKGFFAYLKYIFFALDIPGVILLSAGLALFLLPFSLVKNENFNVSFIIAMLTVGIVCLVAFPFYALFLAKTPILSLRLLKDRTIAGGCLLVLTYFIAFFVYQPYFFSYLSVARNASVATATNITLIFTFSSTVSAVITSVLIKWSKRYKYFLFLGTAVYMIGGGLTYRYRTLSSSQTQLVFSQIVLGAGAGLIATPAQLAVQAACTHQDVATVTALFLTLSSVGGAIGDAIAGSIWRNVLPRKLNELLPADSKPQAAAIFASYLTAVSYPMGSPTRNAINEAYDYSMHILMIVVLCLMVPMWLFVAIMKSFKLDTMRQNVAGNVIGKANNTPTAVHDDAEHRVDRA